MQVPEWARFINLHSLVSEPEIVVNTKLNHLINLHFKFLSD